VQLVGDALHDLRVEALGLSENGERIAAERAIRKHVDTLILVDSRNHASGPF
jgi:hypothetical protein